MIPDHEIPESEIKEELGSEWEAFVASVPGTRTKGPLSWPREQRVPLSRPALFAQLEEVRHAFNQLRALPLAENQDRFVNPGWSLREMLAHLASWAREFREEVEAVAEGEELDYAIPFALSVVGPNQWNEEQLQVRRDRSLDDVLLEFEHETTRLQDLVLGMSEDSLYEVARFPAAPSGNPDERFRSTAALMILGKCQHDHYHLKQIRGQLLSWL